MKNNSEYWNPDDEEESPVKSENPEPKMSVKLGKKETAPEAKKTEPANEQESGIGKVFPAIGQPVEDFDKVSGDLRITELQLPGIKNMADGQEVKLVVSCVKVRGEYEQDSEYNEELHKRIATSSPYQCAKFEITKIEEMAPEKDTDEGGTTKVTMETE